METQQQINKLESRQLELLAKMKESDAHASKCAKLGLQFAEQYPDELAAYEAANAEYNANESKLAALHEQLSNEMEADENMHPIDDNE